jgi:hypothetical protein
MSSDLAVRVGETAMTFGKQRYANESLRTEMGHLIDALMPA